MKINKLALTATLAITVFASTSTLAATRGCDGEVAVHVKSASGQYIGNTLATSTASSAGISPNVARSKALEKLQPFLTYYYFDNQDWVVYTAKNIIGNNPKGNYSIEVKMRTYSNNSGGSTCDSSRNRSLTITN